MPPNFLFSVVLVFFPPQGALFVLQGGHQGLVVSLQIPAESVVLTCVSVFVFSFSPFPQPNPTKELFKGARLFPALPDLLRVPQNQDSIFLMNNKNPYESKVSTLVLHDSLSLKRQARKPEEQYP